MFKVNDKVRVLKKANHGSVKVGTVGVITFVKPDGAVQVGNDGYNWFLGCNGGKLELVKPELVKPIEFKVGDTLRRVSGHTHGSQRVGDTAVVAKRVAGHGVKFVGDTTSYYLQNYEFVRSAYPNPPHKHAELIKAWADGADIEYYHMGAKWRSVFSPAWKADVQYRIKPDAPVKSDKAIQIEALEAQAKQLATDIAKLKS